MRGDHHLSELPSGADLPGDLLLSAKVQDQQDAVVRNTAIYLALGVLPDGIREIRWLWITGTEDAEFCMKAFNDPKTRAVGDILIAATNVLKGMPDALVRGARHGSMCLRSSPSRP